MDELFGPATVPQTVSSSIVPRPSTSAAPAKQSSQEKKRHSSLLTSQIIFKSHLKSATVARNNSLLCCVHRVFGRLVTVGLLGLLGVYFDLRYVAAGIGSRRVSAAPCCAQVVHHTLPVVAKQGKIL